MKLSNKLRCLFSATVKEQDGSYLIEVPKREVQLGDIEDANTYRVAVFPSTATDESDHNDTGQNRQSSPKPPVSEGDERNVEIEDIGDQGDGLTRVERGFVVIVPDTDLGERVSVEITDVRENVAFAEVTERLSYYD